jgi:hypothetical protein
MFNAASGNASTLTATNDHQGDFSMRASFKAMANLVRRRDVYNGTTAVTPIRLQHLKETSVKVASGTPPVEFEPAQYEWIKQNPEQAAIVIGEQLAQATLQDMLNTAIAGTVAAISGISGLVTASAGASLAFGDLVKGVGKFGDRQSSVVAWVMHSKNMTDLYAQAVANGERLFTYGTVNVIRDPFGRLLIMTDSPALVSGAVYRILGLVSGAVLVEQNNDFFSNMETNNGKENIQRSYQAEWSYNLGLYGYSWNTATGGKSPSNAAIGTAANWQKTATSPKDTAGVLITNTTTSTP